MDATSIAALGMQQDQLRLTAISQNLANVLTPGYKKQVVVGAAFAQQMALAGTPGVPALPPQGALAIDASAATLRYSANPHDVAIDGDGFFELAGADGPLYTRQGSLRADVNGRLVGVQQLPLAGVGGEMVVTNAPMAIDASGDVRQGERLVGRLKVVRFANPDALQPVGNGMYAQGGARLAEAGKGGAVRAGFQENSNVNSPQEMVRLTETVRHFESLQRVIQGYDESLEKTIRKLGEF